MPCTYYAAPLEEEGGRVPEGQPFGKRHTFGTPDEPITISDFWKRKLVKPGTVLCLKDGLYRGPHSMIRPPTGLFSGRPGARIEVRAVNDGHVWIDGEFKYPPLRLVGQSYWTVSGLNLFNSRGPAVGVAGRKQEGEKNQIPAHHIILRRIVAWRDYIPYATAEDYASMGGPNTHVFSLADVTDVLVEDSAGFGWGRKIFQNYRSHRVVFRRVWTRWDGRYPFKGGNKFAISCSYQGYDAICENLIATIGGSGDPGAQPPDYEPGAHLIATDGSAPLNARWLEPPDRDVHAANLRILGSLAYAPPNSRFQNVRAYHVGGSGYPHKGKKGVRIENSVASISTSGKTAVGLQGCKDDPKKHPNGCSWELKDDRAKSPLVVERLTVLGASDPVVKIHKDWRHKDVKVFAYGQRVDIYKGNPGSASLCFRYVNGRQTRLPLWPWPMQDRIKIATERSNWGTADVMGEIIELFGAPPPECGG
jgi:hypothetical protein